MVPSIFNYHWACSSQAAVSVAGTLIAILVAFRGEDSRTHVVLVRG